MVSQLRTTREESLSTLQSQKINQLNTKAAWTPPELRLLNSTSTNGGKNYSPGENSATTTLGVS